MSSIIDAHSHFMPPEVAQHTAFFKQGWSDISRHLQTMDDNGIERSVLLYPTSYAHINMKGWGALAEIYNQGIAEVVRKYPDRFIGAGVIPYDHPEARDREMLNILEYGFSMLSVASSYDGVYLDDEYFKPVFQFASENKLPVHVHAQIIKPIGSERVEDPLLSPVLEYVMDVTICLGKMMMSGTFLEFPDVNFIFPHYGGILPVVKDRFDSTYKMLRNREYVDDLQKLPSEYFANLYYDMSGSASVASLQCALEVASPQNILFGSDFPANPRPLGALDAVSQADLSTQETANICGGNVLRLIK